MAATGGITIATTHMATAAGIDQSRTNAQADTKSTRHPHMRAK